MFSIGAPSRLVFTSGSLNHNLAHYNLTWTTDSFSPITAYKLRFKLSKVSADIIIYSTFHKNHKMYISLKPVCQKFNYSCSCKDKAPILSKFLKEIQCEANNLLDMKSIPELSTEHPVSWQCTSVHYLNKTLLLLFLIRNDNRTSFQVKIRLSLLSKLLYWLKNTLILYQAMINPPLLILLTNLS